MKYIGIFTKKANNSLVVKNILLVLIDWKAKCREMPELNLYRIPIRSGRDAVMV